MIYIILCIAILYGAWVTLALYSFWSNFQILTELNKDLSSALTKVTLERDVANRYYMDSLNKKPFVSDA